MKQALFFKPDKVFRSIENYYPKLGDEILDYWSFHILSRGWPMIDRTGTLKIPGFRTALIPEVSPVPKMRKAKAFEEVAALRAKELWDESDRTGKKIRLLCSGGVDSVVALYALMDQMNEERKKRFVVSYGEMTKMEYERLFYEVIKKLPNSLINPKDHADGYWYYPDDLVVTGELGDHIHAWPIWFRYRIPVGINQLNRARQNYPQHKSAFDELQNSYDWVFRPWQEMLHYIYLACDWHSNGSRRRGASQIVSFVGRVEPFVTPLLNQAPFKITNFLEYAYWLEFTCKWGECMARPAMAGNRKPSELSIFRHFFDSEEWQIWSMANYDKNWDNKTYEGHKLQAKKYIFDHDKDRDYYEKKRKVGSLRHSGWVYEDVDLIDMEGGHYEFDEDDRAQAMKVLDLFIEG